METSMTLFHGTVSFYRQLAIRFAAFVESGGEALRSITVLRLTTPEGMLITEADVFLACSHADVAARAA
jgi:hypothetical protein